MSVFYSICIRGKMTLVTTLIITLLLTACGEQAGSQPAVSLNQEPAQQTGRHQASFSTWSYQAEADGSQTQATVQYNYHSVEALKSYVSENKKLAEQVALKGGVADVNVTFRTYLQPDQFRSWAKENNFVPMQSTLRIIMSDGKRGTVWIAAKSEDVLPQQHIDAALQSSSTKESVERGIYTTRGKVDATKLRGMADDPRVFLVDVTPNIVRSDLKTNNIDKADTAEVKVVDPFWWMEDFGLGNFSS